LSNYGLLFQWYYGSEFTAKKVRKFISNLGTLPAFIEPGSPWENGFIESFNLKDEG